MKFTRGQDEHTGIPCWELRTRLAVIDADWNTRFPWGASLWIHHPETPSPEEYYRWSLCLDMNAPLDEPNRLYLGTRKRFIILGLPSTRVVVWPEQDGGMITWKRKLHIDGCDRYLYHRDAEGEWVQNETPEPLHWGWLTIEKRERRGRESDESAA
jgi:hypothetical protein